MIGTTIDLKEHMFATYFFLRKGIGGLGIALPFVLGIGGYILAGLPLQHTMSYYYHTAMRDVFVGLLFFLGLALFLYKGFTVFEDWALNVSRFSVVMAALIPTPDISGGNFSWHYVFTIVFFAFMAYVCTFRASDTLSLMSNETLKNFYNRMYRLMGYAIVALILSLLLQKILGTRLYIFYFEAAAVIVFGSYWIVKSAEIRETDFERSALEGRLSIEYRWSDIFKPICVKRIEPSSK
jgi:hypothetical protein